MTKFLWTKLHVFQTYVPLSLVFLLPIPAVQRPRQTGQKVTILENNHHVKTELNKNYSCYNADITIW